MDYLREIRRQFPTGNPPLDSPQLLGKLEGLSPGWTAWALQGKAGSVPAIKVQEGGR